MKRIVTVTIMLLVLTACTAPGVQSSGSVATETVQAGIPNPASVYCEQNGNKLEIVTAADGNQVLLFPRSMSDWKPGIYPLKFIYHQDPDDQNRDINPHYSRPVEMRNGEFRNSIVDVTIKI